MQIYFALADHYTIGDEFGSLAEALAEAGRRIERIRAKNTEHGMLVPEKQWVDERVRDERGDRIIRRYELEATIPL
jgi:hypothetical protein